MQELALRKLGNIYIAQGRFGLAATVFQHGMLLCMQLGAREPTSDCQRGLGTIHLYQGQLVHAKLHFEEGIVIWRELNHHRWQVVFLHLLARVALQQGDMLALQAYLDEAQVHLAQTRSPGADAYALWLQAELALEQGDLHRAVGLHRKALELRLRFSPKHLQMESQDGLAYVLERLGRCEEAQQLRQSVTSAREAFGIRETDYRKLLSQ
jgi:tetratricopeptide (TPR) repeat protein